MTEDSDERLVELARAGDHRAFEVIIERYRPALVVHCRAIVGDAAAQDAVQQASISAWQALRRGQEVKHVRAWLYAIARRAALEALRRQGAATAELTDKLPGSCPPEELIEQSARARATLAAVAELPPRERDALVWTSLHGRSGRDAAHALGISEGAIRQLLLRARARARAAVHVFLPPGLLARLTALHGPRQLAGLAQRAPGSIGSLGGGEALVWLAPALAAGALAAAHLAPVRPQEHRQVSAGTQVARPAGGGHLGTRAGGEQRGSIRAAPRRARVDALPQRGAELPQLSGPAAGAPARPSTPAPDRPPSAPAGAEPRASGVWSAASPAPTPVPSPPAVPLASPTPAAPLPTPAEVPDPAGKVVGEVTETVGSLPGTTQAAVKSLSSSVESAGAQAVELAQVP